VDVLRALPTSIRRIVLASTLASAVLANQTEAAGAEPADGGGPEDVGNDAGDDAGVDLGNLAPPDEVTAPRADEDKPAFLRASVNHIDIGDVLVTLRGQDVLMRIRDLEKAGMQVRDGNTEKAGDERVVSLASLAPKVTFALSEVELTLTITADASLFGATTIDIRSKKPAGIIYSSSPTVFANYQVQASDLQTPHDTRLGAFVESGASYHGLLFYSSANYVGRPADTYGKLFHDAKWIRQMTNMTYDWRDKLTRFTAGDLAIGAGDVLGGGAMVGGLSASRSFSLDPYFTFLPSMYLSGTALTPSTVEVYVNGQMVRREVLPPGQFNLQNVPLTNGSGETRVVVRDAFGGQQTMVSPYYLALGTLAKGLSDFSYNVGAVRKNTFSASWGYDEAAFALRHRRGLTDWLTIGARAEGTRDMLSGGGNLAMRLMVADRPVGEIGLALGASGSSGYAGAAGLLSYSYVGKPYLFQVGMRFLSDHYANLGLPADKDRQHLDVLGTAATTVGGAASVSIQGEHAGMRDSGRIDSLSLRFNRSFMRWASIFVDLGSTLRSNHRTEYRTFVGLTFPLSDRTTAAISHTDTFTAEGDYRHAEQVTLQRSLPVGAGLGYRLALAQGDNQVNDATAQYQGQYGRIEAEYRHEGWNGTRGQTTLTATGGAVLIGGRAYLTRPVQDSFALIRVPDVAGVHGLVSNQVVGTTDRKGDLLIPSMLSYYGNRIGIDDKDIPLDHDIATTEMNVAPPYRGGTIVTFPVRRVLSATGTMVVEANGKTLVPAYGQLVIDVAGRSVVSPFDEAGNFYLEDVAPGEYPAEAEYEAGSCKFTLRVKTGETALVQLGTVRCVDNTKESE
jgi:outer membrane usher protein